jgi:hypothetical protein
MGSRMVAQRNVAHYLNDAKYRALFNEARDQLRAALEKECGPRWPSARSRPERRPVPRPGDERILRVHHDLRPAAAEGEKQR